MTVWPLVTVEPPPTPCKLPPNSGVLLHHIVVDHGARHGQGQSGSRIRSALCPQIHLVLRVEGGCAHVQYTQFDEVLRVVIAR